MVRARRTPPSGSPASRRAGRATRRRASGSRPRYCRTARVRPTGGVADVRSGGPGGERGRHRCRGRQGEPDPVADHVGAGGVVADPLAARADQAAEERRSAVQGVDLDDPDQRPDEGLLGVDGAAVVADDAQPERELAEGLAAGDRLHRGRVDEEDHDEGAHEGHVLERAVGVRGGDEGQEEHAQRDDQHHRDVDQAGAHPRTHGGRGQVEGDGLARDEVVRGQHREVRRRHRDHLRLSRVDLDAYVLAHHAEWERLETLTRKRRLDGRESDELVERYQRVATHLSVIRTAAPDATLITYLSLVLSRARNRSGRARTGTWNGVRTFATERFPAALYRLRWWWIGTAAANVVAVFVMMWWLLAHPDMEQSLRLAARRRPAGQPRLRRLLQPVRRHPLRRRGLGQQRVGRRPLPRLRRTRAAGRLPAVPERREPRDHRLDHDPARARPRVLGADPPARTARADRGVRGRRRRAAAVLVVGRAGRPHPKPVLLPRGPDGRRPSPSVWSASSRSAAASRRS